MNEEVPIAFLSSCEGLECTKAANLPVPLSIKFMSSMSLLESY